ncbi:MULTISPECIES: hypothetical protein [Aeromonas]|uniref:hypothetical protein n=1 Tax=Aeromonas TaxID=642 RepID=UPI001F1E57E6|nr:MULTISPECIES: hypothetical protein [Aeromonas]MCP3286990.1 hypothetical protein [Aeromonas hydrophila]
MAFPVKWYSNAMQGAPSLGDTAPGALAALLKACLITGFGNLTVSSLAWDAAMGCAVATIDSGHSYLPESVIAISGATPAAYNGEHRVKQVNATKVWFELDGGNPGSNATGTISIKIPGLGWTLLAESADGQTMIIRSPESVDQYPVCYHIDNSAFSGWTHASNYYYFAKVSMVEDVQDLTTFTLINMQAWPATKRYSDGRWDLFGDNLLFYFVPAYASRNGRSCLAAGYINSVRPGDRYHAVLAGIINNIGATNAISWTSNTAPSGNGNNFVMGDFLAHGATANRILARPHSQLFGAISWQTIGLFSRMGAGLAVPNPADNGFYLAKEPTMVLEGGDTMRGSLPGLINPYGDITAYDGKTFSDLPLLGVRTVRFIRATYATNVFSSLAATLVAFDITGPWR